MTSKREAVNGRAQLTLFDSVMSPPPQGVNTPSSAPRPTRADRRDIFNGRRRDGITEIGYYEIPAIARCTLVPEFLTVFSEAVAAKARPNPASWVHFYEDDYKFRRFRDKPERYFERLRRYAGVIAPDCSVYRNQAVARQISTTYENHLLAAQMQAEGLNVIANVRMSGIRSIPWALAGTPRQSTLAVSLHGCIKSRENRSHVVDEIRLICDTCAPTDLVVYGSDAYDVLAYPVNRGIRVHLFRPDTWARSVDRRAG